MCELSEVNGRVVEGGPDIIVRVDARGVILSVSATCSFLGYEPKELVGKSGLEFVHPEDRVRFVENTVSVYHPEKPSSSNPRVHRFKRKDGSWAWLQGHPSLLTNFDKRNSEILNFFEPISEEVAIKCLLQ